VEETLEILPAYFSKERLMLLEQASALKEQELTQIEHNLEDLRQEIARTEAQRTEIEIAISKDETGEQIRNIDREINNLSKERNVKQQKAREFDTLAEMLRYPAAPDEHGFYETLRNAKLHKQQIERQLPELHEQWSESAQRTAIV
jgi:uncharacterized protein YPO0396